MAPVRDVLPAQPMQDRCIVQKSAVICKFPQGIVLPDLPRNVLPLMDVANSQLRRGLLTCEDGSAAQRLDGNASVSLGEVADLAGDAF